MSEILDGTGFPTVDGAGSVRDAADHERAVQAYRFWYPTVSMEGIFNGNRELGIEDNQAVAIAATGPRQVGFTLNSDTPYGAAVLDLTDGPMMVELPPGPYMGLVDDHHQGWVMDLGIPGPDQGKGGVHVVVPPEWDGDADVPDDAQVREAGSDKVMLALRALPAEHDIDRALDALRAVKVHRLGANGDSTLDFVDITERASDCSCLRWEDKLDYWKVLHGIIDAEPLVDDFLPMYGFLADLGIEKGKPFAPDQRIAGILAAAAKDGRDQMLVTAFASERPDRIAWPDRQWEWASLVSDNADFETPAGLDLDARDRWFAQAIVASPAMFRRTEGAGSLYWLGLRDATGTYLDGTNTYKLTVPQPVPAKLFWSLTVYDAHTRSQVQTDQDKAALRSLFELADAPTTDNLDLYVGPEAPAGQDDRWIKTTPGRGWFAYFRIYGPQQAAFDGTWKPDDFVRL